MPEVKQVQAVGVVRVSVSINIPEMPEVSVLEFRQKIKEVIGEYTNADFDLRMTEPLRGMIR